MVAICLLLFSLAAGLVKGFSAIPTRVPRAPIASRCRFTVGARRDNTFNENNGVCPSYDSGENRRKSTANDTNSRRSFLERGLSAGLAGASPLLIRPEKVIAAEQLQADGFSPSPNLKCLLDLPPVDPGSVRIFLCRHGQTDNNKYHLVQGARIDPPLNDTGRSMARRLGAALSFLPDGVAPTVAAHSLLRRAKETATLADATVGKIRTSTIALECNVDNKDPSGFMSVSNSFLANDGDEREDFSLSSLPLSLEVIPSLGEVDFGATIEGRPSTEVRAGMYATYGAWSAGNIDQVMDGEGESGRQVLYRAANALTTLASVASRTGGSVVAVSHSTYLRMLLSTVMNIPLAQGALLEQKNGCINVLDVNLDKPMKELGPKSELLGGKLSMAREFSLSIPETKVVRVNESRHLQGLL